MPTYPKVVAGKVIIEATPLPYRTEFTVIYPDNGASAAAKKEVTVTFNPPGPRPAATRLFVKAGVNQPPQDDANDPEVKQGKATKVTVNAKEYLWARLVIDPGVNLQNEVQVTY